MVAVWKLRQLLPFSHSRSISHRWIPYDPQEHNSRLSVTTFVKVGHVVVVIDNDAIMVGGLVAL